MHILKSAFVAGAILLGTAAQAEIMGVWNCNGVNNDGYIHTAVVNIGPDSVVINKPFADPVVINMIPDPSSNDWVHEAGGDQKTSYPFKPPTSLKWKSTASRARHLQMVAGKRQKLCHET